MVTDIEGATLLSIKKVRKKHQLNLNEDWHSWNQGYARTLKSMDCLKYIGEELFHNLFLFCLIERGLLKLKEPTKKQVTDALRAKYDKNFERIYAAVYQIKAGTELRIHDDTRKENIVRLINDTLQNLQNFVNSISVVETAGAGKNKKGSNKLINKFEKMSPKELEKEALEKSIKTPFCPVCKHLPIFVELKLLKKTVRLCRSENCDTHLINAIDPGVLAPEQGKADKGPFAELERFHTRRGKKKKR